MRSFYIWTLVTKQTLVRLVLTHVCHKFLCTTTAPRALLLPSISHFLVGLGSLLWSDWRSVHSFLYSWILENPGKLSCGEPLLLLFWLWVTRLEKASLNHSWQWGNQLYWRLLFFKGSRPFLATCHFWCLWCQPSGGFQVSLVNL